MKFPTNLIAAGVSGLAAGAVITMVCSRGTLGDVTPLRSPQPTNAQPELGPNASLNGLRLLPDDNAWNTPIDHLPVDEHSAEYLASVGLDAHLHPDFGPGNVGIPYVVVSGDQPKWPVTLRWPDESDLGYYPLPLDAPIEAGSDAHAIVLDRDHGRLYELFAVSREGERWMAGSGAIFDLDSNALRPMGWTSADAAGLPILPGLVRYDEVVGLREIRHALRFTAKKTQRAYVHPARHFASKDNDAELPPMGLRVRLRTSYDISGFPGNVQVILKALKKYGMLLADNGGNWFISGAPDDRWSNEELAAIKRVKGKDLEVVETGNVLK